MFLNHCGNLYYISWYCASLSCVIITCIYAYILWSYILFLFIQVLLNLILELHMSVIYLFNMEIHVFTFPKRPRWWSILNVSVYHSCDVQFVTHCLKCTAPWLDFERALYDSKGTHLSQFKRLSIIYHQSACSFRTGYLGKYQLINL